MKFLVDANLPPRVAKALEPAGYHALHVADVGLLDASDDAIFDYASSNDLVILSSDTDFGTLLARRNTANPSVVLLRRTNEIVADQLVDLLVANLPTITKDLIEGAIAIITPERIRVRSLPMFPERRQGRDSRSGF